MLNRQKEIRIELPADASAPAKAHPLPTESTRRSMLDLQKLETFRIAACTCNFTRAAVELGCCQSTVTVHIREVERELGVRLFERSRFSRDVVLTAAGRRAVEYAERFLALVEETKKALRNMPKEVAPISQQLAGQ